MRVEVRDRHNPSRLLGSVDLSKDKVFTFEEFVVLQGRALGYAVEANFEWRLFRDEAVLVTSTNLEVLLMMEHFNLPGENDKSIRKRFYS